jgi:hypothetical protein
VIRRRFGRADRRMKDPAMGKFGGFLSRRPVISEAAPAPEPANPLELDEELFSAPASAARTKRCAICCSTPATRSTSSTPLRTPSPSLPIRSPRRSPPTRPRNRRKSACSRPQQYPHRLRKLRNEMADLEKRQAATQSECHRRRRPPRANRRIGKPPRPGGWRQQCAARGRPAAR